MKNTQQKYEKPSEKIQNIILPNGNEDEGKRDASQGMKKCNNRPDTN